MSLLLNSLLEIISFKATFSLTLFGISIPMVLLPGTVATLVDMELVLRAMSFQQLKDVASKLSPQQLEIQKYSFQELLES